MALREARCDVATENGRTRTYRQLQRVKNGRAMNRSKNGAPKRRAVQFREIARCYDVDTERNAEDRRGNDVGDGSDYYRLYGYGTHGCSTA